MYFTHKCNSFKTILAKIKTVIWKGFHSAYLFRLQDKGLCAKFFSANDFAASSTLFTDAPDYKQSADNFSVSMLLVRNVIVPLMLAYASNVGLMSRVMPCAWYYYVRKNGSHRSIFLPDTSKNYERKIKIVHLYSDLKSDSYVIFVSFSNTCYLSSRSKYYFLINPLTASETYMSHLF